MVLDKIKTIEDLRKLDVGDLAQLAEEVREEIIDGVSVNGGHIASSLGVVELTIALHYVLNTPEDKLIWDVGHQSYAHKILTGRREAFKSLRKYGEISGFPKITESKFDSYNVGHSSTSISLAVGEAVGRDMQGKKYQVVPIIGDGSISSGMAFEALNNLGHLGSNVIIILNDNAHSISKNVGAMSKYLTKLITGSVYNKFRSSSMRLMRRIPKIGNLVVRFLLKSSGRFKGMFIPGQLFQDMGIRYFGPIDGHNLSDLVTLLNKVKNMDHDGPKIIHVITKKGRGYEPAEKFPAKFHGIAPFDKKTGEILGGKSNPSYSSVVGKTLTEIAHKDDKILAITAAMGLGTGLNEFEKSYPDRFFDVGIAEQHAVTFATSLASTGMKPFVSIYSTFIQRAIDQIIHDVAIMNMPVKLFLDRAGIVGDDGETHHGLFDVALLKSVPNLVFLAPSNGDELRDMIYFASRYNEHPIVIRFPRGKIDKESFDVSEGSSFELGKIKVLSEGNDLAIFALGDMVKVAEDVRDKLAKDEISVSVVNISTIRPIDIDGISKVVKSSNKFLTLENGVISGGVGELILSVVEEEDRNKLLFTGGFPHEFVTHGSQSILFKEHGLDVKSLVKQIKNLLDGKKS